MFPIGSQFYRAPTPLPENWEKDLKTARENGLNIIRVWLMWNWYSQKEGEYDFTEIQKILDCAYRNDLKVILLFNLESVPAWLQKNHPEAVYVSNTGKKYYPEAMGNTPAGGFPGLCLDHQPVVEEGKKFISGVVKTFCNHPALYGYEPHNEPMYEAARYNDEIYCYCEKTIEKFQNWLSAKYDNDIEKLNSVWKRNYGQFNEIQPPRRRGTYADWVDWRVFSAESLMDAIRWRSKAIRDYDTNHPILLHSRGGSGVSRPFSKEGTDDWALAKEADMYGVAAFPQTGPEYEYSIGMTVAKNASYGKEFWMSELQSGPYGMGVHRNDSEPKCFVCKSGTMEGVRDVHVGDFDPGVVTHERLKMWAWSGIAMGAKGILFWQYRCELFGLEYGFGLTDLDGTPTKRLAVAKELSDIIHSNEKLFKEAEVPDVKIAIGISPINEIVNYTALGCHCQIKNSMKGIYKSLWNMDYLVDFVRLDELVVDESYDKYKVIYLPFPIWISPRSVEKLKKWVEEGGTLVCEASAAQLDENFFTTTRVPGLGLDELFGCVRYDIRTANNVPALVYNDMKIDTGFYKEILKPTTGKVIATFETGEPAMTVNNYGKGKAIYIGSNPFYQYSISGGSGFRSFIGEINRDISREVYTDQLNVSTRVLIKDNTWVVFLLNALDKPFETVLTIETAGKVKDLFTGKPVEARVENGRMIINESMKGFETKAYVVEKY